MGSYTGEEVGLVVVFVRVTGFALCGGEIACGAGFCCVWHPATISVSSPVTGNKYKNDFI